ncbi:MAG: Ig domain-containing protein, partial [Acidimicrobiales bacterium]
FKIVSGSLPKGLKLDPSSGLVSGTPKVAGLWSFSVDAKDSTGSVSPAQSVSIRIQPSQPLTIKAESLSPGTIGKPYHKTLEATGGTEPYTWSFQSGTLPPGLSLSASGVISGTPTTAGSYVFGVGLTDSGVPAGLTSDPLAIVVKAKKNRAR